ncbi:MAG TPA: hypothetical protein VGY77_03840 [Gemmataceae bacterium]|nr:hypothetical protein [Gemmataceae bacterium]
MMAFQNHNVPPREEMLAAYVDGELNSAGRLEVEAWIVSHPETAAELEALRQFKQFWQATRAFDPSEGVWAQTLENITTGLVQPKLASAPGFPTAAAKPAHDFSWVRGIVRWTSAAAVFVGLMALDSRSPRDPLSVPSMDPYPVISTEDIDILTVHAADAGRLVVGKSPLTEPLDIAEPGDIVVVSVKPDIDGMLPYMRAPAEDRHAPMMVVPLGAEIPRERPVP